MRGGDGGEGGGHGGVAGDETEPSFVRAAQDDLRQQRSGTAAVGEVLDELGDQPGQRSAESQVGGEAESAGGEGGRRGHRDGAEGAGLHHHVDRPEQPAGQIVHEPEGVRLGPRQKTVRREEREKEADPEPGDQPDHIGGMPCGHGRLRREEGEPGRREARRAGPAKEGSPEHALRRVLRPGDESRVGDGVEGAPRGRECPCTGGDRSDHRQQTGGVLVEQALGRVGLCPAPAHDPWTPVLIDQDVLGERSRWAMR